MKKFDNMNYIDDIRKKIPGYDLCLELIFNGVLPIEINNQNPNNMLCIGGQVPEIQSLSKCYEGNITLVEPSDEMINIVKRDCGDIKRLRIINSRFEDISDLKYEIIFCLQVLQFVDEPREFVKKIFNNLSNEGILFLSVFTNEQLQYWKEFAIYKGANEKQVNRTYREQDKVMKVLNRKEVEGYLIDVGFKDIKRVFAAFSNNLWCVKK
ncbi:class I SAM-dependent methyltransferase [Tissierella sp.]|uniref:class I SAM-dependent methyltransferase n=1 Tax=Tissierella sp. TaxID=41274 RepID=UPI0028A8DF78|nr:class I SAM-dependent methyltransferase [Tissierella sp.]